MIRVYLQSPVLFRRLDYYEKKNVRKAFSQFKRTVIIGAAFHYAQEFLISLISDKQAPQEPLHFLFEGLDSGVELASFQLVESLMTIYFKPIIIDWKNLLPWTVITSVASTLSLRAVKVPLKNYYVTGNLSFAGYFDKLGTKTMNSIGFNSASMLALRYLPRASNMGGEFARSTAAMIIGNLGASIATTPSLITNPISSSKMIVSSFWNVIPSIMFQNALFSIVRGSIFPQLPM